jgi:glycine/D-amino acid oxidase-like deaminating enzyme
MKVVVVGAGITGLAVALSLVERGADTLVLERSGVAAGASGVQPGGIRRQWSTRVNCLLASESLAFYRGLDERLGRRTGVRFDACGYLFLAHGEELLGELAAGVALQNELGIESRIVAPDEAARLVQGLDASTVVGAAWNAGDGYVDRPQAAVEAFAAAARDRGARLEIAAVERIKPDGAGWRVNHDIRCDAVIVAAGCDTRAVVAGVPIEPEARHLFLSAPIERRLLEPLVISGELRFAAKQLRNGRVLASDLGAAGDPAVHAAAWRANIARGIRDLLPELTYVSFPVLSSGLYDLTPDRQPLVGEVAGRPGLWLAAGFSGHGFMLAPAVARRLAAAIVGEPVDDLLTAFAPDRFDRGATAAEQRLI